MYVGECHVEMDEVDVPHTVMLCFLSSDEGNHNSALDCKNFLMFLLLRLRGQLPVSFMAYTV